MARSFDTWLTTKDFDAAVRKLSPKLKEDSVSVQNIRRSRKNPGHQPKAFPASKLLPRVQDIAANDIVKPHLDTEYVKGCFKCEFNRQDKVPILPFFMDSQVQVRPRQRASCVNRMIVVHSIINFLPETLFLAVSLMDHYIQVCIVDMRKMDLLSAAALYVAAKYQEPDNSQWQPYFIARIKGPRETEPRRLFDMEEEILRVVDRSLALPLSLDFLHRNCKAAQASRKEELTARYILELCLVDYSMSWVKPSRQAAGALYCAFLLLGRPRNCWNKQVQHYSGHSVLTLRPLVIQMAKLILEAPERNWAPYKKYSSDMFDRVGCGSETKGRQLHRMAAGIF